MLARAREVQSRIAPSVLLIMACAGGGGGSSVEGRGSRW